MKSIYRTTIACFIVRSINNTRKGCITMKRALSVFIPLILGVGIPFGAAYAQNSDQLNETDQSVKTNQTNSDNSDNLTKEQRIQLEAQKLARVKKREAREERYKENNSSENNTLVSGVVNSISVGVKNSSFCLTYAPGSNANDVCRGMQLMSSWRVGVSFWLKGNPPADFVNDTIPHNNYTLETTRYSTGVEMLFASGPDDRMLILGIGTENRTTQYVAVSNDTSIRWDGGTSHSYLLAASAAYRLRLINHLSVMLGFDTSQKSFFGLTAVF